MTRRLGVDFPVARLPRNLFICATVTLQAARHPSAYEAGDTMRSIVALYFVIGILLLIVGFVGTGPCPNRNGDVVSHIVFVLTWPVSLYKYVLEEGKTPDAWLHGQTCEPGGLHGPGPAPVPPPANRTEAH